MARCAALVLVLACAASLCAAQATGAVLPAASAPVPGDTILFEIGVDVTPTGQPLGSYGSALSWDPAVLQYTGTTGGSPPFDTPVINTAAVASGVLRIADADPAGAPGNVPLFFASFQVIGSPCDAATVALSMSSLHAAATLDDLLPLASVQQAAVFVDDHDFDLMPIDPNNTLLNWNAIPGAASYDVIRIDPSAVYGDPNTVHLGTVTCLEDDSADATTGAGTESSNPDTSLPLSGEAFYYLVRLHNGSANGTYGFTGQCARERLPDAGDCS